MTQFYYMSEHFTKQKKHPAKKLPDAYNFTEQMLSRKNYSLTPPFVTPAIMLRDRKR